MRHRILLLSLGALVLWAMPVVAFHDDGVAHCDGCHTMHNSVTGESVAFDDMGNPLPLYTGNDYLLKYASSTDVCLSCHGETGTDATGRDVWAWGDDDCAAAPTDERGAGKFNCQNAANISDSTRGGPVLGERSGHTLMSVLAGRANPDLGLPMAPGGSYLSANMTCTSCHDPHGTGNFRLLYGDGQIVGGVIGTWVGTLQAVGISLSTRSGSPEANDHHNVYQDGYGDWCANCHANVHDTGEKIHPTDRFIDPLERGIYNGYIGSVDCQLGPCPSAGPGADNTVGAYLAQVPFEDASRSDTSSTEGPGSNSKVTCVTCHRAHGSSAESAGRWSFAVTALEEDGTGNGTAYALPNPYGAGQRSLCNKCHAKDAYDAPWVP